MCSLVSDSFLLKIGSGTISNNMDVFMVAALIILLVVVVVVMALNACTNEEIGKTNLMSEDIYNTVTVIWCLCGGIAMFIVFWNLLIRYTITYTV